MNHNERPIGWTTIDEAKRLICANVDNNTADMWYHNGEQNPKPYREHRDFVKSPCWSLGALFNLLPKQIGMYGEKYYLIVSEGAKLPWSICYADVYNEDHPILAFQKETLVEACIEMIAALKVAEKEEKAIVLWPNVKEEGGAQ
jgi:hypothetical protein